MMKMRFLLLIILTFSFGCEKTKINHRVIHLNDAIVKTVNNPFVNIKDLFKNVTPIEINENEIKIVDSLLLKGVESFNIKQKQSKRTVDDLIDIENYQCNYIPVLNEQGEKIIYIIAKRVLGGGVWWEVGDILGVKDGYISVFRSSVNLSKKTGANIRPNGEA